MGTSCVRFNEEVIPYDVLNSDAKLLNFGVSGSEAKFPTNINNRAGWFKRNGYVVNAQDNLSMAFAGTFTLMFWAKFTNKLNTDDVYGNRWILILDDGSSISFTIFAILNCGHSILFVAIIAFLLPLAPACANPLKTPRTTTLSAAITSAPPLTSPKTTILPSYSIL